MMRLRWVSELIVEYAQRVDGSTDAEAVTFEQEMNRLDAAKIDEGGAAPSKALDVDVSASSVMHLIKEIFLHPYLNP